MSDMFHLQSTSQRMSNNHARAGRHIGNSVVLHCARSTAHDSTMCKRTRSHTSFQDGGYLDAEQHF